MEHSYPGLYAIFWFFVVAVAPILWSLLYFKVRKVGIVQRLLPHPVLKPWDYVFKKREAYWVIVTLKDGNQIGGRYDSSSFASSSPAPEQIYLEESWIINDRGGFERKKRETAGLMVLGSEIAAMDLFRVREEI